MNRLLTVAALAAAGFVALSTGAATSPAYAAGRGGVTAPSAAVVEPTAASLGRGGFATPRGETPDLPTPGGRGRFA